VPKQAEITYSKMQGQSYGRELQRQRSKNLQRYDQRFEIKKIFFRFVKTLYRRY
jgi:hypothetical protein